MSEIQLRKGSTDSLVFYPPEDYAPATATLTLSDSKNTALHPATWPLTVSRDNVSTTVDVAATQGSRTLTLADITNIVVDVFYLLGIPDGRKFRVKVIGINASLKQIFIDQPIPTSVAVASTLIGLAYRYPLTATATATIQRRCQASWVYTVSGSSVVTNQSFDIVNHPWSLKLTEKDVEEYDHCFGETAGNSNRWQSLTAGVSMDLMRWIEKRKLHADLIKDRDYIKKAACLLLLARFYSARPGEDSSRIALIFNKMAEIALAEIFDADIWYDLNANDSLDGASVTGTINAEDNAAKSELQVSAQYLLVG